MTRYTWTTQAQLRAAFRREHPSLNFRRIRNHEGTGTMFTTDVRCAFGDWIDGLERAGDISAAVATRVTIR